MSTEINHNKIINQAARSVLKPLGLFQKGQSRTWIDDNGWFLIIVEFQPSNWAQGTYLNVAVHYLWAQIEYLSYDYGGREESFVPFIGDEGTFYDEVISLAEIAVTKVTEYRAFKDASYAKGQIIQKKNTASESHELYNKMMICGLVGDSMAMDFYKQLMEKVEHSTLGYEMEYYNELTGEIGKLISDVDKFRDYIVNKIGLQREFWRAKSSMRKLKEYIERLFVEE